MTTAAPGVYLPGLDPEHEHWSDRPCTKECESYGTGYRSHIWPYANDASEIARTVRDIRFELTDIRTRIGNLNKSVFGPDFDSPRNADEARGCVQGAIVILYAIQERYEAAIKQRAETIRRVPR